MLRRLALPLAAAAAALAGIAAPVRLLPAAQLAPATATCPTCCPQGGATCVICGSISCSAYPQSYDAPVGSPCENES